MPISSGTSTSIRLARIHPVWPWASRTSHQSSNGMGAASGWAEGGKGICAAGFAPLVPGGFPATGGALGGEACLAAGGVLGAGAGFFPGVAGGVFFFSPRRGGVGGGAGGRRGDFGG